MPEKPRRRWFRFKLRTLFVLVAVAAVPLAWVRYSLEWVRQRDEFVSRNVGNRAWFKEGPLFSAPFGIWVLGEHGCQEAHFFTRTIRLSPRLDGFPEAQIIQGIFAR